MASRALKNFRVAWCVIAGGLLFGCAGPAASRATDFYPLRAGTTWVFQAKFLGREETRTIVMGSVREGFWLDDAGGKFQYDGVGLRDERRYLLKEPLVQGTRWSSVTAAGVAEDYEIISVHTPCAAPAGRYSDCLQVVSRLPAAEGKTLENVMTYARQVGLVSVSTTLVSQASRLPQVEMELVEFRGSPK